MTSYVKCKKFCQTAKKYTRNLTRFKLFKPKYNACLKNWFKIWRVVKNLIQNLTRRKNLNSKSDKTKNFLFKITLFTKTFSIKIMLLKKSFFVKIVLFKSARKTQNLRILQGKMRQDAIFCMQIFFKIVLFRNNFFFKILLSQILFFFKNWRVVKNSTSKSDAL